MQCTDMKQKNHKLLILWLTSLVSPLPLDLEQRKGHPGCCITRSPKEKPLQNLTEKGFKALQDTASCSCLVRPQQPCHIHPSCAGQAKAALPPGEHCTKSHPGQHLETTGERRNKNVFCHKMSVYNQNFWTNLVTPLSCDKCRPCTSFQPR